MKFTFSAALNLPCSGSLTLAADGGEQKQHKPLEVVEHPRPRLRDVVEVKPDIPAALIGRQHRKNDQADPGNPVGPGEERGTADGGPDCSARPVPTPWCSRAGTAWRSPSEAGAPIDKTAESSTSLWRLRLGSRLHGEVLVVGEVVDVLPVLERRLYLDRGNRGQPLCLGASLNFTGA